MRLILIIAVVIVSCSTFSEKEKLNSDIKSYQDIFEHNRSAFQLIGDSINSIAKDHRITAVKPNHFREIPSKIAIHKNGNPIEYVLEIDSINGANYFYRIRYALKNRKSHCSILSYCYLEQNTRDLLVGNKTRNVTYELLNNNWSLEIDQSSPCIE